MVALNESHPAVYTDFLKGKLAVKKSRHAFSVIAIDQAHKQNKACVKGDGWVVGLAENPAALCRWMVSGPEMACVIGEFEGLIQKKDMDYWTTVTMNRIGMHKKHFHET